jgi:hypothetical protein
MPCYVIVRSGFRRTGETIDATLCEPNIFGFPNHKTDVPVRVRLVSEQVLAVDGENHRIISCVGESGTTTYLVNGSSKGVRNRERRVALARASELSEQLRRVVTALGPGDNAILQHLEAVAGWLSSERERATTAPRSIAAERSPS